MKYIVIITNVKIQHGAYIWNEKQKKFRLLGMLHNFVKLEKLIMGLYPDARIDSIGKFYLKSYIPNGFLLDEFKLLFPDHELPEEIDESG